MFPSFLEVTELDRVDECFINFIEEKRICQVDEVTVNAELESQHTSGSVLRH